VCYANTFVATVGASEALLVGDVVQGKEFGMRRLVVVFMVLAMLMVLAAAPALAVGVSADCGSQGGFFYTRGYAYQSQYHTHDGTQNHFTAYGWFQVDYNWGWETLLEYGTVTGTSLTSASAMCPN